MCGKVLVMGWTAEVTSVRRCQKLPSAPPWTCWLVKAEPFYNTGSTSGITYLRRCKRYCTTAGEREECECERNSSANTLGRARGEGAAPGSRAEIPWYSPERWLSPWRAGECRDPSAAPGGAPARAGGCLKEAVTPREACAGAGSW